jgi:hypothetical protein
MCEVWDLPGALGHTPVQGCLCIWTPLPLKQTVGAHYISTSAVALPLRKASNIKVLD